MKLPIVRGLVYCLLTAYSTFACADINVGVIAPLSGSLASYGKSTVDGMKVKVAQINAAGGVDGEKINLIIEDNKGDKTETKNAYMKLVGTNKVVAVMGPITSTNTIAIKRDAAKLQVPVISPTATNDKATKKNDYMFRTCFKDSFQGQVIANYVFNTLKISKAACIVDMSSDYSKGLTKNFISAFEKAGGSVVAQEGYRQSDIEFKSQLKKVVDSGAEILFVPGYPPQVPLIVKEAASIGFKGRLCGADGWDASVVYEGSGPNLEGCFITGMFSSEDKRPIVQNFIKTMRSELGRDAGTFEAQGYDTAAILAEALKKGTDSDSIKNGLLSINNYNAVTGTITITSEGDAEKPAVILTVIKKADGTFGTQYTATVNP